MVQTFFGDLQAEREVSFDVEDKSYPALLKRRLGRAGRTIWTSGRASMSLDGVAPARRKVGLALSGAGFCAAQRAYISHRAREIC